MSYRTLPAQEAFWRPSNQMGVLTPISPSSWKPSRSARDYGVCTPASLDAPSPPTEHELYVLLEGTGRIRIGQDLHTLEPLSSLLVDPVEVRQLFNDTDADQLWLVVGAPPEAANTLEMTPEQLAWLYPTDPRRSHQRFRPHSPPPAHSENAGRGLGTAILRPFAPV